MSNYISHGGLRPLINVELHLARRNEYRYLCRCGSVPCEVAQWRNGALMLSAIQYVSPGHTS